MDDTLFTRLAVLLCGLIPIGLSVIGLWTGKAFLPTNQYAGKPPWVSRKDEPWSYWPIVIAQLGCGLLLATLPYWRL
jgi:hypothetical protein